MPQILRVFGPSEESNFSKKNYCLVIPYSTKYENLVFYYKTTQLFVVCGKKYYTKEIGEIASLSRNADSAVHHYRYSIYFLCGKKYRQVFKKTILISLNWAHLGVFKPSCLSYKTFWRKYKLHLDKLTKKSLFWCINMSEKSSKAKTNLKEINAPKMSILFQMALFQLI